MWNTHEIDTLKARLSALLLPSLLCPCPGENVGPPPRASLPSGLWSVSQEGRWELGWGRGGCPPLRPFRLPQAGPHWRPQLRRWPLCPLSPPHLCLLATASFSPPEGGENWQPGFFQPWLYLWLPHIPVLPLFKSKTPCTAPSSSNPNLSVIYSSGILTDSVPSEAAEYIQV